jgi:hypothetical protein
MFCMITDHTKGNEPRTFELNTGLIAYFSVDDKRGQNGSFYVEIGFSGGGVLNLTVNHRDWDHFRSILDSKQKKPTHS